MLFYTQLFTSKRGSLAKIWLAAHWERKLTKAHVFECNLESTVRDIISPKMKIGLRTSGHLLVGVVRIYSRKAKYLLADCSDALVRIKVAFRPGQTDMPVEGQEATIKAITLMEDFTAFDVQLPHPCDVDMVDHFTLNQSRSEEITLKEDFGNGFLSFADIDESLGQTNGLLHRSYESHIQHRDTFGDEDKGFDLLDFLTNSTDHAEPAHFLLEELPDENQQSSAPTDQHQTDADRTNTTESLAPTLNETTLLTNENAAFTLEPVAITPNSVGKKMERKKRKLVVDQMKELSYDFIREQLSDYSDLVSPLDMAPPTAELMQWKEIGGAEKLLSQPCSTVVNLQIKELFAQTITQVKCHSVREEVEVMRRERQEAQDELMADSLSVVDSFGSPEKTHNTQLTALSHVTNNTETSSELSLYKTRSEYAHPDLPSEDSMLVHPSVSEQDTQRTSLHTQSVLDSQDFEERRITRRAQKLLTALKQSQSGSEPCFSLKALCDGGTRSQAAATFLCLLVLRKQQALHLHQAAPYEDILATPGPTFYH